MSGLMGRFLCLATVITDGLRRFVPVLLLMIKHNQKLTANTFHKNYHIQCDSHNKNRSRHRSLFNLHKEPWGLLTVTAAPMFLSKLYQKNRLKTPEVWLNLGLKNSRVCTHTHTHIMLALTPYVFSFFSQSIPINTTQVLEGVWRVLLSTSYMPSLEGTPQTQLASNLIVISNTYLYSFVL